MFTRSTVLYSSVKNNVTRQCKLTGVLITKTEDSLINFKNIKEDKIKYAMRYFESMNSYLLSMDNMHKEKMKEK